MSSANLTDSAWLDAQYNNRALVPAYADHFARWQHDSAVARNAPGVLQDVAYGHGPGETLDLFLPKRRASAGLAPVMVFIHGGYWRSLDKADHSFVAPPFVAQGSVVVVPNYALCPAVTIPDIAMQMVRALAWTWHHIATHGGDPDRITVVGHSAGGHLAAMLLGARWQDYDADLPASVVRNALAISGLYDLEPLRHTPFLQDSLRLTPADVAKASPVLWPAPVAERGRGALVCVAGGDESEEFRRQNALLQAAWGPQAVPVCENLPGLNHFSVLEALVNRRHKLYRLAQTLLSGAT